VTSQRQIELLEQKIAHLTPEERETTTLINKDERQKMAGKAQIDNQLQEYHDILNSFVPLTSAEEEARAAERKAFEADLAAKAEQARKEGVEEGIRQQQKNMEVLLMFLRLAGYRRAVQDTDETENDAIEKVLVMVYSSEASALHAVQCLVSSSPDLVEGSNEITCTYSVPSRSSTLLTLVL